MYMFEGPLIVLEKGLGRVGGGQEEGQELGWASRGEAAVAELKDRASERVVCGDGVTGLGEELAPGKECVRTLAC